MSSLPPTHFTYVHSCDLDQPVKVKIGTLEGSLPRIHYEALLADPVIKFSGRGQSKFPDLLVEATVVSGEHFQPMHVPVSTSYKHHSLRFEWNEWLRLPVKYGDLPRDAHLCITLYDCDGPDRRKAVGGTTLALFGTQSGVFRQGQLDLRVWADKEADRTTLGKGKTQGREHENLQRLSKLCKEYKTGRMTSVDWLDRLTFAEVEKINQKEKQTANMLFLMVKFEEITFNGHPVSVVYFEKTGAVRSELNIKSDMIRVPDFDIMQDNLVEAKHHRLARSARAGQVERDLKPNAEMRNRLSEIISYPSSQPLTSEEQDNVWRYRYYLSSQKKALTKFVKCINWKSKPESTQALDLIMKWAPMAAEDALELLGPTFKHPALRQYAVQRLRQAKDEDLEVYLLQLVQALKYEKISPAWLNANLETSHEALLSTASMEDSTDDNSLPPACLQVDQSLTESDLKSQQESVSDEADLSASNGGLAGFLIERACHNYSIANYLYWYLVIECEEPDETPVAQLQEVRRVQEMYNLVLRRFKNVLKSGPSEFRDILAFLERQSVFMEKLVQLIKLVQRESGNRQKKIERLQALLSDASEACKFNFVRFEALRLPLDPTFQVCGVIPEKASLFKSSLMPARLSFVTTENEQYVTLFKHGDDLRQDQLILQIITLMDKILRQENLDLCLTPYKVLATSTKQGFVQFVESMPIADILTSDGSIQNYFRKHNPMESGPYGIKPEVMDKYVKSCAGYCVITFILGVGDRHLDNLMITRDGRLFHIDFGYILGRDPKVLPPPMKLSKEMIEAFGGMTSEHYQEFRKECYTAFLGLRRYSNVILNLFSLMVNASVPDIALEPDKTVKKVQDKFRLDLNDEEAVKYMQQVIEVSAMAVMPAIVDRMHKLAQFMRN